MNWTHKGSRLPVRGRADPQRVDGIRSGACVPRSSLKLLGAAGRATCSRMPVVRALLQGRCFSCLVDTGSERTLVSPRVVVGQRLKPGRPLLTADGNASHVGGQCRVFIGVQGHCFGVTALVMTELGNLGVDCLLGGDVIDHMGGVTVRRDPNSKYVVKWGKPQPRDCCGVPQLRKDARSAPTCGAAKSEDPDSG